MMNYIFIGLFIIVPCIMVMRAFLMRDALKYFKKIKDQKPDVYRLILGKRKISWIERGYHLPSDIGIQIRLYKFLYSGLANEVLSGNKLSIFKNKIHVLMFFIIITVVLVVIFSFQVIC